MAANYSLITAAIQLRFRTCSNSSDAPYSLELGCYFSVPNGTLGPLSWPLSVIFPWPVTRRRPDASCFKNTTRLPAAKSHDIFRAAIFFSRFVGLLILGIPRLVFRVFSSLTFFELFCKKKRNVSFRLLKFGICR